MRYLGLILFLPAFGILVWLYLAFPRSRPRSPATRRYDSLVLVAVSLATALAVFVSSAPQPVAEVGPIWPQVLASLAAFHVFPLLLLLAWWLRGRVYR